MLSKNQKRRLLTLEKGYKIVATDSDDVTGRIVDLLYQIVGVPEVTADD